MKKFISKARDLSQRAAELKAAAERVPAQVRDLRETVAATTGQLQQLRADVQSSVSGLRADGEEQLVRALTEIEGGREVLREAGYELTGADIELGPVQRLVVHLEKFEDVSEAGLGLLLASVAARRTTHAVLAALIRAEQLADRVELSELAYRELTIYVGPVPTVRLCWRPADAVVEDEGFSSEADVSETSAAATLPPPLPAQAGGSFFAPRAPAPVSTVKPEPAPAAARVESLPAVPRPQPAVPAASPLSGDWKANALDRFKKMPDFTRR